ncbi:MAG TPA: TetR/AcrR family transcriptional regulator [Nocardioides sp.]|uniref:TetR/AcrR family transcriptional regulator n=1 Tax=Nocardioides sp. TaxID=35761 RepID=UPI002F3EF4CD
MTTQDKLLDAAAAALAEDGVVGVSARTVAARADVNQALVFYHFGSVAGLLDAAVRRSVDLAVASYRDRFADVTTLGELLTVGRDLHQAERRAGNVLQMAQVLAGAQRDETLAGAGRYALDRWCAEVEAVLTRVLPATPLAGLVDPAGLARAVAAGFVGIELYDGVDADAASSALASLDAVGALVSALDGLPPVAVRAVRGRARRAMRRAEAARRGVS